VCSSGHLFTILIFLIHCFPGITQRSGIKSNPLPLLWRSSLVPTCSTVVFVCVLLPFYVSSYLIHSLTERFTIQLSRSPPLGAATARDWSPFMSKVDTTYPQSRCFSRSFVVAKTFLPKTNVSQPHKLSSLLTEALRHRQWIVTNVEVRAAQAPNNNDDTCDNNSTTTTRWRWWCNHDDDNDSDDEALSVLSTSHRLIRLTVSSSFPFYSKHSDSRVDSQQWVCYYIVNVSSTSIVRGLFFWWLNNLC